jgi:hypothetical protein
VKKTDQSALSLAAKWDRSRQLMTAGAQSGESRPQWEDAVDLEADVLRGPIVTMEDVVAKLKAIQLAFTDGERTDGADAWALRQTIRWLQTQHGAQEVETPRSSARG